VASRYGTFVDTTKHTQAFTGSLPGLSDDYLEVEIIAGGELETGKDYIVAVSAQISTDNNTYYVRCELTGGNTTGLEGIDPDYDFERTSVETKNAFFVGRISSGDLTVRIWPIADNNSSGAMAGSIDSIVAWWVQVEDFPEAWGQGTRSSIALSLDENWDNSHAVTITATSSNFRWLVMDCSHLEFAITDVNASVGSVRINRDDTEYDPSYSYMVARAPDGRNGGAAIGMFRVYDLSPGSHTFTTEAMSDTADVGIDLRRGSIVAVCLNGIIDPDDHAFIYTAGRLETGSSLTDIQEIAAYTPEETFDHVVMGWASYMLDNANTDTFNYRLRVNDSTDLPTGHYSNTYYGRNANVEYPMMAMGVTSFTADTAYELDLEVDPDDSQSAFRYRSIVVFTLDVPPMKKGAATLKGRAQIFGTMTRLTPQNKGEFEKVATAAVFANGRLPLKEIDGDASVTAAAALTAEAIHILYSNVVKADAGLVAVAQMAGGITFFPAIYTTSRAGADMRVEVLLPYIAEGGFLLVFRYVDYDNYWTVRVYEDVGQYLLQKVVSGTVSVVGTLGPAQDGDRIRVLTIGDLIQVDINGVLDAYEDSDLNTATRCGIGLESSNSLVRIERFQAWDLTERAPNPGTDPGHTFYGAPETWK